MISEAERRRRWRLALGADAVVADGSNAPSPSAPPLTPSEQSLDQVLTALYPGGAAQRRLGARQVERVLLALDDVAAAIPAKTADDLRRSALAKADLGDWLQAAGPADPALRTAEDPALAAALLEVAADAPEDAAAAARRAAARILAAAVRRLRPAAIAAFGSGGSPRGGRRRGGVDWRRSIEAALMKGAVAAGPDGAPQVIIDQLRRRRRSGPPPRELVILLDQSASMRPSHAPAAVLAASLAGLPGVRARLLAFDDRVADLSDRMRDPIGVLLGATLGGDTDLPGALSAANRLINAPERTAVALISDLGDARDRDATLAAAATLIGRGVRLQAALALTAEGAPRYNKRTARALEALGARCQIAAPEAFVQSLAAALSD